TFALAAGDTNPQDIADPPPADMLLTPANGAAFGEPSAVTGTPSLPSRDAVFALLAQVSLQGQAAPAPGAAAADDAHVIPFKVTGGGTAPLGFPLARYVPVPHNATGTATHLGQYTAEGMFQLTSFTSATTGTFNSAVPVVFVAANGDQIAFNYAGTFQ